MEIRALLAALSLKQLSHHANECLTESVSDNELVLQDITNEVGHGLVFVAANGRYWGKGRLN
ncbi:NA (fragment) [Burkholderiales bacterium]